jgi:hypothetical protein
MRKLFGVLAVATALSACSTAAPPANDVASLDTDSPRTSTSTSSGDAERPRLRLDMTPEDEDAIYAVYSQCMADHGVDKSKFETSGIPSKQTMDAAEKACESKRPLPPWELDPKNPEALDFATQVVECLRGKGVRYVEVYNEPNAEQVGYSFGGPNNDHESITKGLEFSSECEREVSQR